MTFTIAARLKPFSHTSGSKCPIPNTDAVIEAFPHLIKIGCLEIPLDRDPFENPFTMQLDLENDSVKIFGKDFLVQIRAQPDGFEMRSGKKVQFFQAKVNFAIPSQIERLSLGSHKAQDWDLVLRRRDLKEILPPLYLLSQKVPDLIWTQNPFVNQKSIETFFDSSFSHILAPREEGSGPHLFQEAFWKIRSLFFIEEKERFCYLPKNPFPEGRMLNIQTRIGVLDMEWSKKLLRRGVFKAKKTDEMFLDLPKEIKTCRVKTDLNEKGFVHSLSKPLLFEKGKTYFLDRFYQ